MLKKNEEKVLEIKNTVTETKNAADGLICRLDMTEERNSMAVCRHKLTEKQRHNEKNC